MRYWLGPWSWSSEGWSAPLPSLGCLDLRPLPAMSLRNDPQGVGLFALADSADPGTPYVMLGSDLRRRMTQGDRSVFEKALNVTLPAGASLAGSLWEALTVQSDPTGQNGPMPLTPGTLTGCWRLLLAGEEVVRKRFDASAPEAVSLQARMRSDYKVFRNQCVRAGSDAYRKTLGYWVRKYGLSYRWFQPDDVPDESPLEPETTINDTFNRADADALGTSSDGDWSWTETTGDADIVSNAARAESDPAEARAEKDLAGDDHYSQAAVVGTPNQFRDHCVCVRFDPSARNFYYARVRNQNTGTVTILKMTEGTPATLFGPTTGIGSIASATLYLQIDGSDLDFRLGGVSKLTGSDGTFTTFVRTGLRWENWSAATPHSMDNFQAADLAAPPAGDLTFRPQWAMSNHLIGGG